MKRVKRVLGIVLQVILIIYVILITTLLLYRNKFGYTQFDDITFINVNKTNVRVFSDFNKGDLVLLRQPYYDEVNVGDYLYYYTVQNSKYVIEKGKVLSKDGNNSGSIYTLDATDGIDVSHDRIIGIYEENSYTNVGLFLDILESTIGFLVFVILPILLIFIYQFYNLVILIKTPESEIDDDLPVKGEKATKKVSTSKKETSKKEVSKKKDSTKKSSKDEVKKEEKKSKE